MAKSLDALEKKQLLEYQKQFSDCYKQMKEIESRSRVLQENLVTELDILNQAFGKSKHDLDRARVTSEEFIENLKTKYEMSTAEIQELIFSNNILIKI